jgi:uncharacterized protein YjbJ (UPF0337 family)
LELALGMSADFAKFNQNFGVIFDWKGKLRENWGKIEGKMKGKNEREKWKGKMREKWGKNKGRGRGVVFAPLGMELEEWSLNFLEFGRIWKI